MSEDLPPTYSEACQTRIVIPNIPETSTADQHPPTSSADNAAFEGDNRPPSPSDVQVTFDYPSTDPNSTSADNTDIMNELSDYQQESYVRRTIFVASYINYANQQDPTNNNRHLPAEYRQRYEQEIYEDTPSSGNGRKAWICCRIIWLASIISLAFLILWSTE